MSQTNLEEKLNKAIKGFNTNDTRSASLHLLRTLGYGAPTLAGEAIKPNDFLKSSSEMDPVRSLSSKWQRVDLLMQLTNDWLSQNVVSSDILDEVETAIPNRENIRSYVFIAVELEPRKYTRTQLATITREINKAFPMPIMVLFKYDSTLTLSVINRRQHKTDSSRFVLERVSMIKDIDCDEPHRGHIKILSDLAFPNLGKKNEDLDGFDYLHQAWERVFSTQILNNKYFKRLFDWYDKFAYQQARFPNETDFRNQPEFNTEKKKLEETERRKRMSLIRFLSRFLFVWFIKEKGWISDDLFDDNWLSQNIKDLDHSDSSSYYKAVIQNLFFGTLATEIKDRKTKNYKHQKLMKSSKALIKEFSQIPFLNGGLFECLDLGGTLVDGFDDSIGDKLQMPNSLFFDRDEGLISILNDYKFTIEENTSTDVDVALDPELLGRVFENLLATYNPETQDSARRETGSFYTPRVIVDHMVDQSLKSYLKERLSGNPKNPESQLIPVSSKKAEAMVSKLFEATDQQTFHDFTKKQRKDLVKLIRTLKAIDLGVGSGAFPMALLNRMVQLSYTLDQAYEKNSAYSTKLYFIRSCLFGVDIQPIAIQITKLRFSLSLAIEQNYIRNNVKNFQIQPLPNLETQFVVGNTCKNSLLEAGLEQSVFIPTDTHNQFNNIRQKFFEAKTSKKKLKYEQDWRDLQKNLLKHYKEYKISVSDAKKMDLYLVWSPFDQERDVNFFCPHTMCGIDTLEWRRTSGTGKDKNIEVKRGKDGFDIVIGNPPFKGISLKRKEYTEKLFPLTTKDGKKSLNRYQMFIERGLNILKRNGGILVLITQASLLGDQSKAASRRLILNRTQMRSLIHFSENTKGGKQPFKSVTVSTSIFHTVTCTDISIIKPFKVSSYRHVENFLSNHDDSIQYKNISKYFPKYQQFPLLVESSQKYLDMIYKNLNSTNESKYCLFENYIGNSDQGDIREDEMRGRKYEVKQLKSHDIRLMRGEQLKQYCVIWNEPIKRKGRYLYECLMDGMAGKDKGGLDQYTIKENYTQRILTGHSTAMTARKRIRAAVVDTHKAIWLDSVDIWNLKELYQSQNYAFVAILNTKFMDWYFRITSTNDNVPQYQLQALPFPNFMDGQNQSLLKQLNTLGKAASDAKESNSNVDINIIQRKIDDLIYDYYEVTHVDRKLIDPNYDDPTEHIEAIVTTPDNSVTKQTIKK